MKAISKIIEELDDFNIPLPLTKGKTYHIIGIEYQYFRVVNDLLDPILIHPVYFDEIDYGGVSNWIPEIDDDAIFFTPSELAKYPYFYQILHEGDGDKFIEVADVYMNYLSTIFEKEELVGNIFKNYLSARDNKTPFPFWLKQWLKHRFSVDKAIELRSFSEKQWFDILVRF